MRPSIVAAAACAGLASSQCLSSIPECAQTCITDAATQATTCGETDWACQCTQSNHQTILQDSENCVEAACGEAQWLETVKPAADAFCNAINGGEACSTTTSAGTATTTGSGSTPTTSGSSSTTAPGTRTGTATGTATGAASSSSAGAAAGGVVSLWGMVVLGVLAVV